MKIALNLYFYQVFDMEICKIACIYSALFKPPKHTETILKYIVLYSIPLLCAYLQGIRTRRSLIFWAGMRKTNYSTKSDLKRKLKLNSPAMTGFFNG